MLYYTANMLLPFSKLFGRVLTDHLLSFSVDFPNILTNQRVNNCTCSLPDLSSLASHNGSAMQWERNVKSYSNSFLRVAAALQCDLTFILH